MGFESSGAGSITARPAFTAPARPSSPPPTPLNGSARLPDPIITFVRDHGDSNFSLLAPPTCSAAGWGKALNDGTLTVGGGATPTRTLVPMPLGAVQSPMDIFVEGDQWAGGWTWLYDPHVGNPVVASVPEAQLRPRGVAVLFHGSGTAKSHVSTLFRPGNAMQHEGWHVVSVPKPFHGGFGPTDERHTNMPFHMDWMARTGAAALDYYPPPADGSSLKRIFMGRSTGGNEVLQFAHDHPDKVDGVVSISPYHPGWSGVDTMMLHLGQQFGLAVLNDDGMAWCHALDQGQWTFLGNSPAFPTSGPLSPEQARAFFAGARDHLRNNLIASRLPQAVRDIEEPLIELTVDAVRRLFPAVVIPNHLPVTPLSTTAVSTLIYIAGPDLEYLASDPYHFVVWALAAAGNPNVRVLFAPFGDHDPFENFNKGDKRKAAAEAFRRELRQWLNTVSPVTQTKSGVPPWSSRLQRYLELTASPEARATVSDADFAFMTKSVLDKDGHLRTHKKMFNSALRMLGLFKRPTRDDPRVLKIREQVDPNGTIELSTKGNRWKREDLRLLVEKMTLDDLRTITQGNRQATP